MSQSWCNNAVYSSSSLLPPRCSFLLALPSSSSLLLPCSSIFLVQHCLNNLESIKDHFPSILTKALRTDGRTDQPTDRRTDKASYRDARTHLKIRSMRPTILLLLLSMFFLPASQSRAAQWADAATESLICPLPLLLLLLPLHLLLLLLLLRWRDGLTDTIGRTDPHKQKKIKYNGLDNARRPYLSRKQKLKN